MTDPYRAMCSDYFIQAGLKWVPKVGDKYLTKIGHFEGVLKDGFNRGPVEAVIENFIWLPRIEDWIKRLSDELWKVTHYGTIKYCGEHFLLCLDDKGRDHSEAEFGGPDLDRLLCRAWAWTIGLKWENNQWGKSRP